VLLGMLVAPYLAENIQYALTRGQLRARSDFAGEELSKLAKTAELVKLSDTSRAFRLVAERIEPCVVHINTEQTVRAEGESPFDEFFGLQRGSYRAVGQGSGVIIDGKNGYVITNYHVIQGASLIEVRLSDNRVVSDGEVKVVGSDVLTDLAVLKIPAEGLIAGELGDSSKLQVGDWVLAVGNPYGLDRTVTCGIVSALQRRAFAENSAYQNFLQTDAAVNPGNSGGPLMDISGQVIGITTAIVGKAYQGISFAIPSEVVRDVYQHLIARGSVPRGYLGVGLQELTPEIAKQLKLRDVEGVLVTGVQPGSPAEKAGLVPGDVVTEWNGQKVSEPSELRLLVAGTKIGTTVPVRILREGRAQTLQVTVTERRDGG
jgi:serine protease Do